MRVFFSGGSPIPECNLKRPDIMLSYFVDGKSGRPNARMARILKIRKKSRVKKCQRPA